MLKMTIDNEEVLSNNDISIKEEILSPSSTILNNVYPKSWELDKDYTSRFYYPKDYSKLNIQNFNIEPEEAGKTIQINGSATLNDVDTSKESRVLRLLGQTSQTGTPTPSSPIPINLVSGDNKIQVCGKNLLPDEWTSGSISGSTGQVVNYGSRIYTTNKIILDGNTTYCFKHNNTSTWSIRASIDEYDKDNNHLGRIGGLNGSVNGEFTTQSNTKYINITIIEATDTITYAEYQTLLSNGKLQPMLNVGSSASTYEPYQGDTYNIDLPSGMELCKIGTYQDYIYKDNGSWYLHKEIGKVVLNGSEAWSKSSNTNVNRYYIPGTFINTILNVSTIDLISDYFTCITPIQSDAYSVGLSKLNNTSIMVNFSLSDTSFDTLQKFKTWLSTHNVVVYYVLATPTNTEITDTNLIEQLESLSS